MQPSAYLFEPSANVAGGRVEHFEAMIARLAHDGRHVVYIHAHFLKCSDALVAQLWALIVLLRLEAFAHFVDYRA